MPISVEALSHCLQKKGVKGLRNLYEIVAKVSQSPYEGDSQVLPSAYVFLIALIIDVF